MSIDTASFSFMTIHFPQFFAASKFYMAATICKVECNILRIVVQGISKNLAAERTEVVGSAWNVSRTQSTVPSFVLGQPLRFLS